MRNKGIQIYEKKCYLEKMKGAGNIEYGNIENGNIEKMGTSKIERTGTSRKNDNNIENGNIENNTSMLLRTEVPCNTSLPVMPVFD
jgi:hypothetical protein